MIPQRRVDTLVPAESWDDDFEFHQQHQNANQNTNTAGPMPMPTTHHDVFTDDVPLKDKIMNYYDDPTPTTAKPVAHPSNHDADTENWDDDFEDSPIRKSSSSSPTRKKQPSSRIPHHHHHHATWDDNDHDDDPHPKRTRPDAYSTHSSSSSSSSDHHNDEEEDKTVTVTARSRKPFTSRFPNPQHSPPPPPVPPLPHSDPNDPSPFPRSPSISVFSMPASTTTTARSSSAAAFYTSTTHLRRTTSGGSGGNALAMLPPSPPIHRERRRLRKKSRPPRLDDNIFELEDRVPLPLLPLPIPLSAQPPSTPSPPPQQQQQQPHANDRPPSPSPARSTTLSLARLSRIGSVKKKWTVRKKKISTGPSPDGGGGQDTDKTPRPPSSLSTSSRPPSSLMVAPSPPKNGWFFRSSSGPGTDSSPGSAKEAGGVSRLVKRKSGFGLGRKDDGAGGSGGGGAGKRPTSMQVQGNRQVFGGGGDGGVGMRHASYQGPVDLGIGKEMGMGKEGKEGARGFLGGVRRISFGGKKAPQVPRSVVVVGNGVGGTGMEVDVEKELPPIDRDISPPSPSPSPPRPRTTTGVLGMHSASSIDRISPTKGSPTKLQQHVSLGRSTQVSGAGAGAGSVPRRNSLGDLKIPSRIIQAQGGLRRDLGMVREFAANVEQLRELQATYEILVLQIQSIVNSQTRAASPPLFHLPRPASRNRSNTNPLPRRLSPEKQLATAFYTINSKYRVPWECAALLIELGGGGGAGGGGKSEMTSSVSAPAIQQSSGVVDVRSPRERAITLAGDESMLLQGSHGHQPPNSNPNPGPPMASPPPNLAWRASTGRHDLSHRQLVLLREILNSPAEIEEMRIPEEGAGVVVDREWRWGDAMNSTVTLPSGEDDSAVDGTMSPRKKKKRRVGMRGLREMLRGLKRNHTEPGPPPMPHSQVSLNTDSSVESHQHHHLQLPAQNGVKGKVRPMSARSQQAPALPYNPQSLGNPHKSSPRRPSIASIFRLGQKSKSATPTEDSLSSAQTTTCTSDSSPPEGEEEEDWDQMDSASDLEAAGKALGGGIDASTAETVKGRRGKSPYLQHAVSPSKTPAAAAPPSNASQSSIWGDSPHAAVPHRMTRLSNVEESVDSHQTATATATTTSKPRGSPSSRKGKKGTLPKSASVRSAPPMTDPRSLPDPKLAMTPENIRPLLENSREVQARLVECIEEVKMLLAGRS